MSFDFHPEGRLIATLDVAGNLILSEIETGLVKLDAHTETTKGINIFKMQ